MTRTRSKQKSQGVKKLTAPKHTRSTTNINRASTARLESKLIRFTPNSFITNPLLRKIWIWLVAPALLYGVLFFVMQPHYLGSFSHRFYLDNGDGLQNVWNVWWVNHAVAVEHINPYYTTMLHWPHGTSLLPQTMNIYNGLVGILLMHIFGFSLVETVNFAVVFGFIFGGITMLWFIQKLHHKYWVSVFAGALFTFSSYHFAHAQGHLQLVSFEFIPLFFLAFWTLLEKMRYRYAMLAAGALFLVLLCDYYYFLWSVLVASMWLGWQLLKKQVRLSRHTIYVLALFSVIVCILCTPLVLGLLLLNKHDPLTGSHDPVMFSLDPLSVVMPGGSWYWHSLTDSYTTKLAYLAETSVFFGFGLLILLVVAFIKRFVAKQADAAMTTFWWIVLFVFGILALGPRLRTLGGRTFDSVPLPYFYLEKIFPTLQISGMPVRWILISLIAAIIIGSWLLAKIDLSRQTGRVLVIVIVALSLIDLWPQALPQTPTTYRPYVYFLKMQPYGAVIDDGALTGSEMLYNQTLHQNR